MQVKPKLGVFGIYCETLKKWHTNAYKSKDKASEVLEKMNRGLLKFQPCSA